MLKQSKPFLNYISLKKCKLYLFYIFWLLFWISLGTSISLNQIISYDLKILKNFLMFLRENIIIIIFIVCLSFSVKKKLNYILLLLTYPISSYIGSLLNINTIENHSFYLNYLISISSIILFAHNVIAEKYFTAHNAITLTKISLTFLVLFFFIILLPEIIIKFNNNAESLRGFDEKSILLGRLIFFYIPQNSNGASRIILIIILYILVKSNFVKNKKIILINYLIILTLGCILYFYQSKINILFYFLFSIILIKKNNFFHIKTKFLIISIIILTPILTYNYSVQKKLLESYDKNKIHNYDRIFEIFQNIYEVKYSNYFNNKNKITENNLDNYKEYNLDNYKELREECILYQGITDKLTGGRVCGWILVIKKININKIIFGYGFFEDQKILKYYEKVSSNSYIFLLYNSGILGLSCYVIFFIFFYKNFSKFKLIKNDLYNEFTVYLFVFLFTRSFFEDSIVFLSIDLILMINCIIYTKKKLEFFKIK